jgi:hypothetical protein
MSENDADGFLKVGKTARGFALIEFEDKYGAACSLQKSSVATFDAIWFGVDEAEPRISVRDAELLGLPRTKGQTAGWVPYAIPPEVLLTTRMHLTREQVRALLPYLTKFAEEGEL